MRVAIVSAAYPPASPHGGIATQAEAKARGLAALGHEVHVVTRSKASGMTGGDGVRVWGIEGADGRLSVNTDLVRWIGDSVEVAAAIERVDAEVGLDVVEFAEWGSEGFVHLLNRTEWTGLPTVVHVHGPLAMLADTIGWPESGSTLDRVGRAMESTCLRLADGVYASAATSAAWVAREYGLDADRVPIWHTGVDTNMFRPDVADGRESPTIIAIGRLDVSKGVDELVAAAIDLAREMPGLRLRLIGPGTPEQQARLHARCVDAGFPELLETPGRLSRDELPAELARAHVFALPSWYEGGPGLVYLEAMSAGLPVVGPSGSGVEEVVEHGVTGLLVPPRQVEPLRDALREVLADRDLATSLGTKARAVCVQEYDTARRMPWLSDYLERVVAGTAAGR